MKGGARAHTNVDRPVDDVRDLRGSDDVGLFASEEPTLFCVDGNNLLWRAAHGQRAPYMADDGRDLTPLFRFFTKLRQILGTYGLFAECIVSFDGSDAWAERLEVDATYKSNRSYEDKDLSFMGWLPEIKAALGAAGITVIEIATCEADDVIATLVRQVSPRRVRILSTDRDYYQLVSETTTVISPRETPPLVTAADIEQRYGIPPTRWLDMRTLAGDTSDGIPGLQGIGPKKAVAMLADCSLEELKARGEPLIVQRWDDLMRWRELMRPRDDVDLGVTPTGKPTPKLPSVNAICEELGLVKPRPRPKPRARRR